VEAGVCGSPVSPGNANQRWISFSGRSSNLFILKRRSSVAGGTPFPSWKRWW
jgi:hypothetical protein